MTIINIIGTTTTTAVLALAFTGVASADSTVTESTTGPNSNQMVEINNQTSVKTENVNEITITNTNVQSAQSGAVSASGNTAVGNLSSGDATNESVQSTDLVIGNAEATPDGASPSPVDSAPTGSVAGVSSSSNGGVTPAPGMGGGGYVLPTGGQGGGAILPVTGPSTPIDVSALRDAWQAPTAAPTENLVKDSRGFSTGLLTLAAILSLIGAIVTSAYARRSRSAGV